jgi:hypothetical protein
MKLLPDAEAAAEASLLVGRRPLEQRKQRFF